MNILDNKLVQKYFFKIRCPHNDDETLGCTSCMAFNILKAMEEPIKKGEKWLFVDRYDPEVTLHTEGEDGDPYQGNTGYHPQALRLPDQFQPLNECRCKCHDSGCNCGLLFPELHKGNDPCITNCPCPRHLGQRNPDPVEEKVTAITSEYIDTNTRPWQNLRNQLRELVELVRKEKP